MNAPARPNDFLHRYVLRPYALTKVRDRITDRLEHGRREGLRDAHRLHPDAKTIFDLGANIGYVTHDLHRKWPKAKIYEFEPTEATFATLRENVGSIAEVECIRSAVSDEDGTAQFLVDNRTLGGGANSLLDHAPEFALTAKAPDFHPVEVPTLRLDTFCGERHIDHIDLMKIDIEGAEPLALAGAAALLADSAIDVILTEVRLVPGYVGGALLHDLTAQLATHDYRPFGVYHFALSTIGQSMWGDALYLGPAFRRKLVAQHGARACGFAD